MRFWTGLFPEMDRDMLVDGANTMLKVATKIFIAQSAAGNRVKRMKIEDCQEDDTSHP